MIVSVTLEVEVNDHAWAYAFGAGDGYDRAEAQARRSLVADVEDYIVNQITQSTAAIVDEAITGVDVVR